MTARNLEPDWHTEGQDAIPMLANLELFAPQGAGPDSFHLGAILRCGEATEASDDARIQFRIRLRRGYLAVEYQDCSPVAGSHQHDHHASQRRTIHRETERECASNRGVVKIDATAGLGPAKVTAGLQKPYGTMGPQPSKVTERQQTAQDFDLYSVRYRGRDRGRDIWEIGDGGDSSFLDWRYFGDDHLCVIVFDHSTRFHIIASFYFYAADMEIIDLWVDGRSLSQSEIPKNRMKILKIIIQKAFDNQNGKMVICGQRLWRADGSS